METVACPMCPPNRGTAYLMGYLGNKAWFRCRQCGWEFAANDPLADKKEKEAAEYEAGFCIEHDRRHCRPCRIMGR